MTSTILALAGLTANMLGVGLAFFYGYPQPSHQKLITLAVSPGTTFPDGESASQHAEKAKERKSAYTFRAKLGLGLMFAGFALQFIAVSVQ